LSRNRTRLILDSTRTQLTLEILLEILLILGLRLGLGLGLRLGLGLALRILLVLILRLVFGLALDSPSDSYSYSDLNLYSARIWTHTLVTLNSYLDLHSTRTRACTQAHTWTQLVFNSYSGSYSGLYSDSTHTHTCARFDWCTLLHHLLTKI